MKWILVILLISITYTSYCQINDENAFFNGTYDKSYIQKNRIKSVTINSFQNNKAFSSNIFRFDKAGILQDEKITSQDGEWQKYIFRFNEYGDLIMRISTSDKKIKQDTVFFYLEYTGGLLTSESSSWFPKPQKHRYNHLSQRIETVIPYNAGLLVESKRIIRNEYDSLGKIIHVSDNVYTLADSLLIRMSDRVILYHNNKIQRIVEQVPAEFHNRGNIVYRYDDGGNITAIISDIAASYYCSYDKRGLLISRSTKMPDEFKTKLMTVKYSYSFWE